MKNNRFVSRLFSLSVLALSCCLNSNARADLQAGAARVDITPDPHTMVTPLGGYAARKSAPATGVHDKVYSRAIVLANGTTKIAIVSVDLCFLPASAKAEIVKRVTLAGVSGLNAENIVIAATHSHTSPDPLAMHSANLSKMKGWTSYVPELAQFEEERIAGTIILAAHRLMPARLGIGTLDCTGLNKNRRNEKITDPTMTLVRVTDIQGRSLGAIVNFAAHPTLYDDKMMEISADWPGAMSGWLETTMGGDAVALFLNGAEGDASPDGVLGATPSDRVANYGTNLAQRAWDVLRLMQMHSEVPISYRRIAWDLPERKPNALFVLAARSFGATMAQSKQIVNQLMPEKSTLGLFTVGDVTFLTTPCEPSGELGLSIKSAMTKSGIKMPAIVALADDWIAYALTREQYHEGNYEAGMSFYGDGLGGSLLTTVERGLPPHQP